MSQIRSRPTTREYRENFDRIFRQRQVCAVCGRPGTDQDPLLIGHMHHPCVKQIEALRRVPRRFP